VASAGGSIGDTAGAREDYAEGLRYTGCSVRSASPICRWGAAHPARMACAVSDHRWLPGVVVMTAFAPKEIVGIAYDSGGVTTSTITVPWSPRWGWVSRRVSRDATR